MDDTAKPGPDESDAKESAPDHERVGELVARLAGPTTAGELGRREQARAIGALAGALTGSARTAGRASVLGGRWVTDLLIDTAPKIPIRDLPTLQAQHPGLAREDLAATLIAGAAKATGAVGAAGGALAAVEFVAPRALLAVPVQIAAETFLVAAIEMKLIAELHEVYDAGVAGTPGQRAAAYLQAWTTRRGIDPFAPGGIKLSIGVAARRAIRRRLVGRAGRNLSTLGPMMSGAVAGSIVNHRETRRLGEEVRADLRRA